jgi:hypothetical protein
MSWPDLENKFRIASRKALTPERQQAMVDAISSLKGDDLRPQTLS